MAAAGLIADIAVPAHLEASEPPEARGLRRDEVRLLVSRVDTDAIRHARFHDLPEWLSPGDLLVVNVSGTLKASLKAEAETGDPLELHLSTRLPGGFWSVEVRRRDPAGSRPSHAPRSGSVLRLPDGGRAALLAPYPLAGALASPSRLWIAALELPCDAALYLERHGAPIRYRYVPHEWPIEMYQTVFAQEPGSAEMPSAARPFTPQLVATLVSRGVEIAPLLLHAGVASLEDHEPPYEESYRVPAATAERINAARRRGGRVVAVGTTVVRALETVANERGIVSPGEGWTTVVITRDRPVRAVDGLITGLHEPGATHLAMLEAVARAAAPAGGADAAAHLARAYATAIAEGYLWHEFGDSHLIVGRPRS